MIHLISVFVIGLAVSFFSAPHIISIAKKRYASLDPDIELGYLTNIPALGGIVIFIGFTIALLISNIFLPQENTNTLILTTFLMFLLGLKDDFEPLGVVKKLVFQAVIVTLFISLIDITILQFDNYTNIPFLKYLPAIVFTLFITNSINFLDGINGLCGGISALFLTTVGVCFYLSNAIELALISFALSGAILSFLYYNITPARIFMGDTGSLFIGLIISYLAINLLNGKAGTLIQTPIAACFGFLLIPIYDSIRVILARIIKFKKPFNKDKTHIHHFLLDIGFSHMKSTTILILSSLTFILCNLTFQFLGEVKLICLNFLLASMTSYFVIFKSKSGFKNQILNSY